MGDWQSIFKKSGKVFMKPQEDMKKVISLLKKLNVKKVLDLGCGTGRHTVLLAKEGFDVYATDVSKEGLKLTRKWLKEENLKAEVKEASCFGRFPFEDNFFDAVISIQVIHHNYPDKIKYCISEMERVLKPNGILFVTVSASKYKRRGATKFKITAPRVYVPLDGEEARLPHYIYTKKLLIDNFKNIRIINIHKDIGYHYCLLGKLKKNKEVKKDANS